MSGSQALNEWTSRARVLLVDDEPANLTFLRHVLETEGYGELVALSDPVEVVERFAELSPDVIVTDLRMPRLDGFALIAHVQSVLPEGAYLPILVATGDPTPEARRRALSLGARDFLTKPLSPSEVRLRVRNLMETRFLHEQLKQHNLLLEQRVDERTRELEEARLEILYRLARAAELRDDLTGQHTLRVGRMAGRIARVLGLGAERAELIARAAPLHDIGKIGVPDSVLLKAGRLEEHERSVIETHTTIGADILAGSRYPLLQLAEEIALSHHERWDGRGYPHRLAGDAIPLSGRVVAVADVYDALTHERPYKPAWSVREALIEIEACSGSQFDPTVVEALLRMAPELGVLESAEPQPDDSWRATADEAAGVIRIEDAAMRRLQQERDTLAREVEHLREQLAQRAPAPAPAPVAKRTRRVARRS